LSDRHVIYTAHRTAQEKYAYFLLAAAGAAIALTVNRTQDTPLNSTHTLLGIAVLSWSLSFFFGCRHLNYVSSNLFANLGLITIQEGREPSVGTHPDYIQAASDGVREAMKFNSNRSSLFARLQFNFLVLGAVCYVSWHILGMYLLR
jgi:hypothetical protein